MGNNFLSTTSGPAQVVNGLKPFFVTGTLTSGAAGTAVTLLSASLVGTGVACYVTQYQVSVAGSTAWVGVTNVLIQDTSSVTLVTIPLALLLGNAFIGPFTSGVTNSSAFTQSTGATSGAGLTIVANTNGSAGSNLIVTLSGYIK